MTRLRLIRRQILFCGKDYIIVFRIFFETRKNYISTMNILNKSNYFILCISLIMVHLSDCSGIEQRSKEANCLIVGYQKCIINYANISHQQEVDSAKLLKNSATDCWRISRTNDAKKNPQVNCSETQCLWGGGCVNSMMDENDGYHTTENLPIYGFYDDAHTITISFPTYLDTVLYVLESRPLATDGKTVQPWTFAGVSNETSISYRILDICQKYEFRPTAILNNGTVISFLPKVPTANPPDFIVDTLKLDKMYFEESEQKAVAVFLWKKPYGYTSKDVVDYDNYLHATQCDISGEYAITKKLVKTEDGGAFRIEFPENMIRRKCKFLLTVWAHNICGAKTVTEATANLDLSCARIEGYKCPDDELKPKCITHIVTTAVKYDSSTKLASVNASWVPHGSNVPQYYHVKWGPADLQDMQLRPPPLPPPPHTGFPNNDFRKPNFDQPPEGFEPPPGPPPHGPHPPPGPGFDLSVWHLRKGMTKNEKVDGTSSTITLIDLHLNENYGVQVCAIYNADFKTPDWPVVPVSGFTCLCTGSNCESQSSLKCQDPDWFQLNKEKTTAPSATTSFAPMTTRLSQSGLPAPMPPGVVPPGSKSIGPVEDFTQTLVGWEYNGLRMSLKWNPPSGLISNQMIDYRVSLESLRDCNETQICCNFAQFPDMKQDLKNSSEVSLLVSKDVLRDNCQFMVKIIAVAINGAQSVSLKNIVVPKPVVDSDMVAPEPVPPLAPVVKSLSQDDISVGGENNSDKMSSNSLPTIKTDNNLTPSKIIASQSFNCTHLECSHICDDTHCLCPQGFSLSNDNRTCVNAITNGTNIVPSITDAMLARCQELGCQYSCNSKNECVCPSNMNLTNNGKTCTYKDPNLKAITAPTPLATTTYDAPYWCLQEDDQVSIVKTNLDVYIIWNQNQSWVEDKMMKNYKSPVVVRWGEIKTIPFLNLHKMINETVTSMTDLSTRKLFIGRLSPNRQYGFQFCIFKNDQSIGLVDWKLPTVLVLTPSETSHDPSSSPSRTKQLPSTGVNDDDANGSYVKKLIVMAVVIPLCCLIIVISLSILLCHFYPKPFRIVAGKLCSKKSSRSTTTDDEGADKSLSAVSGKKLKSHSEKTLSPMSDKILSPTDGKNIADDNDTVKTSLEA